MEEHLLRLLADYDETLMEKFFEDQILLHQAEIRSALRKQTIDMNKLVLWFAALHV